MKLYLFKVFASKFIYKIIIRLSLFTDSESPNVSPLAGPGPGGHKPSFKGTKLARRARSFKDDFLEKISQMRSPSTFAGRSHSPKNRTKTDIQDSYHQCKGPIQEIEIIAKQVNFFCFIFS